MQKWGFIYTLGTSGPRREDSIGTDACTLLCVGVADVGDAPEAARGLVADGVELIELCGAFAGPGLAAVLAAVDGAVPVGTVLYGGEAAAGLHRLFG